MVEKVEVARVLYDFATVEDGEISLTSGAYVQVLKNVNEDWLQGYFHGKVGNFPAAFVERLSVVSIPTKGKVFICIEAFPELQAGDLAITPGDVIVGLEPINADWWRGHLHGEVGIFPLTHAEEVELKLLSASSALAYDSSTLAAATSDGQFLYKLRAVMHSHAQLDDELGFSVGDVIDVIREEDADWLIGTCNGRTGMFLRDLTEPVEGSTPIVSNTTALPVISHSIHSSATSHMDQSLPTSNTNNTQSDSHITNGFTSTAVGNVLYSFQAESISELTLVEGQVVTNIRAIDSEWGEGTCNGHTGIYPFAFVQITGYGETETPPLQLETPVSMVAVLYAFSAVAEDEISLAERQMVSIVGEDVEGWSRVRTVTGQEGLCPSSFLEGAQATTITNEQAIVNGISKYKQEDKGNRSRPSSVISNSILDYTISAEMAKATSDANKKLSQRKKPARPSTPQKPDMLPNSDRSASPVKPFELARSSSPSNQVKRSSPARPSSPANAPIYNRSDSPVAPLTLSSLQPLSPARPASPARPLSPARPASPARPLSPAKPASPARPLSPAKPASPARPPSPARPASPASSLSVTIPASPGRPLSPLKATTPIKPFSNNKLANSTKSVKQKSARPFSSAQPHIKLNSQSMKRSDNLSTSLDSSPYDSLKEPFETKLEWRDEHPAPLITRRSAERPAPVKPPPPKRLHSSSDLVTTSNNESSNTAPPHNSTVDRPIKAANTELQSVVAKQTESKKKLENIPCADNSTKERDLKSADPVNASADTPTAAALADVSSDTQHINEHLDSTVKPSNDSQLTTQPSLPSLSAPRRPAPSRPAPSRPAPSRPATETTSDTVSVPSAKPIPTRPAPSRPAPSKPVPVRAAPRPPTNPVIDEPEAVYDEHAANHLRERIQLLERDIENYNTEVENLDGQSEDGEALDEKLSFYMENINGMTLEVDELRAQLHTMESLRKNSKKNVETNGVHVPPPVKDYNSPEMREKRRVKRVNKLDELIKTEQFYLRDLKLCVQVFNSPTGLQAPEAVDKDTLFGYIDVIIRISEKLLGMLEASMENVEFDSQVIGKAFLELQEEMKESYSLYTKNYDEVTQLLEQYKTNGDVRAYFAEGLDMIAKHRPEKPFTVDAFLITPVQRIPRYIMLLMELFETTEATHPDKEPLQLAKNSQEEVAVYVNEFKRRTDIVRKYKAREREDEDRLSRFNMHSIRKKTNRVSRRIGNYVGLSPQYVDRDFDKEAAYCKDLETSIRDFTKNLDNVLSNLRSCHDVKEAVATDISEYVSVHKSEEVKEYLLAQQRMSSTAFKQFKSEVESSVCNQLLKVLALFQGPFKLITKRGDKRLDFDSAHSKFEKYKDDKAAKEELDRAKKDFHALNTQLKEELPKFNSLVYDIFKDSVSEFARLYRTYFGESYGFILPILELPSMKCSPGSTAIMDRFERDYQASAKMLTMNADPKLRKVSESKRNISVSSLPSAGVQSPEIRSQLTSKYPPNKLYKAISSYSPLEAMEVGLSLGDLVGVIQQKDPMGSDERWYIDNGATMGLVKKSILQPVRDEPDSQPIKPLGSPLLSPASPHQQQPQSPQIDQASPPPSYDQLHEIFQALYEFHPRNANELSLKTGQILHVHRKCDEHGNPDWWYSESSDGFGYAPANYLIPCSKT